MGRSSTKKGGQPVTAVLKKTPSAKEVADRHPHVRVLTQPEVLSKLDRVQVFNIVTKKPYHKDAPSGVETRDVFLMPSGAVEFYADASDAEEALRSVRAANPTTQLGLEPVQLSKAFAMVQGLNGIRAPVPSKLLFSKSLLAQVGDKGVPEHLRERMSNAGPFPLLSVPQLCSPGAAPFFLSYDDLSASWVKSGRPLEELPKAESLVTDLRVVVASAMSQVDDWRPMLFMAPKTTTELIKRLAAERQTEDMRKNMAVAKVVGDAEADAEKIPELAHADAAPPALISSTPAVEVK